MLAATQQTGAVLWCGMVMPDHVHLLLSAGVGKSPLDTMACFKRMTTLAVRGLGFSGPLWQRRIHDRGIRVDFANDIERAAGYVLGNPVRCGLVASWQDWPLRYVNRGIDCGG
jgi:REP element-mobilizing transposase RayT